MSANPPKIVIFGDSHYACIRMAQTGGLFDPSGLDLEYWGHVGRRFNFLEYRDGAIVPKDEFTADRFAKFNERNRRFLPAADFDMVVFMGARIDVTLLMAQLLMAGHHLPSVSRGLRHRMARDRLHALPAYGFARGLAATKTARIVVAPVSFPTEGLGRPYATPSVQASSGDDRAVAWEFLAAAAAEDGVTFIPQDEGTVTGGLFTEARYAVDRHREINDYCHRNAAYGAVVMQQVLRLVRG